MTRRLNWNYLPDVYNVDDNLEELVLCVNDPYTVGESHYELDHNRCMESVVAGVSERLGLPQGLSFEEVFNRLG